MRYRGRWLARGAAFVALGLLFVAVLSFAVMTLWNLLIPGLFRGPVLGFWQAAGLLVLSRILFGSFRGGRGRHAMWRERWENLTPEERARLRERFRAGCRGMTGEAANESTPTESGRV